MSLLLRAHINQLLSLPKQEREQIVAGWEAKRLAEKAAHEAKLEAEKAELRRIHGEWADDPDFFPF
jgi:hypothetical protein